MTSSISDSMAALEPSTAPITLPYPSLSSASKLSSSKSAKSSASMPPSSTSSPPSSPITSSSPRSIPSSPSLSASGSPSSPSSLTSLSAFLHHTSPSKITNHTRVQNLVAGLATKGITVTEWGPLLYSRLDVPVGLVDFDFLVDDDLLEVACSFTEEQGYCSTGIRPILLRMHGKFETIARHFNCFGQRVNFYPASFAGFRANELFKVPMDLDRTNIAMPVVVFTTGLAPLAASFVRIISRVHFNDPMRRRLKLDLCQVLTYNMFDMSYEGDYMVLGEESQEDIDRQINRGLDLFRKLEGWRDDEMWIADALEAILQGKGNYDALPTSHTQYHSLDYDRISL